MATKKFNKEVSTSKGTTSKNPAKIIGAKKGRVSINTPERKALVSVIQKEYKRLKKKIEKIEAKYGSEIPSVEAYHRAKLDDFSVRGMDIDELKKAQEDIEYIGGSYVPANNGAKSYYEGGFKTLEASGTQKYIEYIEPWLSLDDGEGGETRPYYEKIKRMYERLVEGNLILEKFKYQVLETITDLVMADYDEKEIYRIVDELHETLFQNDMEGKRGVVFEYGGKVTSGRKVPSYAKVPK